MDGLPIRNLANIGYLPRDLLQVFGSHPDISHPSGRSAGLQPAFEARMFEADNMSALRSAGISCAA